MKELHEYAYCVLINAVVRVKATSEEDARETVESMLEMDLDHTEEFDDGTSAHITEGSFWEFTEPATTPFEIDGEDVETSSAQREG